MPIEIERKFLLLSDDWRDAVFFSEQIVQGYLANTRLCSVRLRLAGNAATLSVKSMAAGLRRDQFEYPVPAGDARQMLAALCTGPLIEKRRHVIESGGHRFEVDEFAGENVGLVVAELELADETEPYQRPFWLGDEITDELRYYNFRLVVEPFASWPAADREAARRGRHLESAP